MQKFSTRLKNYREAHRLTQGEMGNKLGVTDKYVSMLEREEKAVDDDSTISQLLAMYEAQDQRQGTFLINDDADDPVDPHALIKAAMRKKVLGFKELSKVTKIPADVLRNAIEGNNRTSERVMKAIADALNLNVSTLMAGQDENIIRDQAIGTFGATPEIEVIGSKMKAKYVPLISMAQAGTMMESEFTDGGYSGEGALFFDVKDPKAVAIRIVGDSMEPRYYPGDVVLAYPSSKPHNGDVVIARLDEKEGGGVVFKMHTSRDSGERIILSSFNPAYPTLEMPRRNILWMYPVVQMNRRTSEHHQHR